MEQAGQQIFEFLQSYGYWGMLPLMIIEGPLATIIAAMLASLGAFSWVVVFGFSVFGDVVGDVAWYGAGRKWGMSFVKNVGRYMGITEKSVMRMEKYFHNHGGKTIFLVKSTTGLCWAAFIAAGIVKMNIGKFIKYSILGGVIWSGFLVGMGYFYGYLWRETKQYIDQVGWIVSLAAIISFVAIAFFKRKKTEKIFENNGLKR